MRAWRCKRRKGYSQIFGIEQFTQLSDTVALISRVGLLDLEIGLQVHGNKICKTCHSHINHVSGGTREMCANDVLNLQVDARGGEVGTWIFSCMASHTAANWALVFQ